jgi:AcrB/AcrD/AcrF family protein
MAALLGAMPLALGAGTGSELRRPLGVSIIGGLLLSQLLTLYTTPVVYLYMERWRVWIARRWNGLRGVFGSARRRPVEGIGGGR